MSAASAPFQARRFQSTALHYLRGRLAYPSKLIERVVELARIAPMDRVLDLGCGPGFLAVAFRRHVAEAVGIDPEPDMIAAAGLLARESGVEIVLRQGSSYDLGPELGTFRLAAMGRSFHWMDREATLRSLDALIEPGGAVALFRDRYLDVPENGWRSRYTAFLDRYKADDAARDVERSSRAHHEPVLLNSPFSSLERISVVRKIETSIDELIDRALSFSATSPERLGERKEAFVEQLRRLLHQETSNHLLVEIVETEALMAFRPGER